MNLFHARACALALRASHCRQEPLIFFAVCLSDSSLMDGPMDGPAEAFARLAALNPLNPAALTPRKPSSSNAVASDNAFVLLRPAAVKGALISEICQRFEKRGLVLSAMRMIKPGADMAKRHYSSLSLPTPKLADLVGDLAPGPAVAMLWRGIGAIATLRSIVGDDVHDELPQRTQRLLQGDLAWAGPTALRRKLRNVHGRL